MRESSQVLAMVVVDRFGRSEDFGIVGAKRCWSAEESYL